MNGLEKGLIVQERVDPAIICNLAAIVSMPKWCTMSFLWPPAAVMLCCSVIVPWLVPMDSLLDHYESEL